MRGLPGWEAPAAKFYDNQDIDLMPTFVILAMFCLLCALDGYFHWFDNAAWVDLKLKERVDGYLLMPTYAKLIMASKSDIEDDL